VNLLFARITVYQNMFSVSCWVWVAEPHYFYAALATALAPGKIFDVDATLTGPAPFLTLPVKMLKTDEG
jgi:hypothetical protein